MKSSEILILGAVGVGYLLYSKLKDTNLTPQINFNPSFSLGGIDLGGFQYNNPNATAGQDANFVLDTAVKTQEEAKEVADKLTERIKTIFSQTAPQTENGFLNNPLFKPEYLSVLNQQLARIIETYPGNSAEWYQAQAIHDANSWTGYDAPFNQSLVNQAPLYLPDVGTSTYATDGYSSGSTYADSGYAGGSGSFTPAPGTTGY